MIRRSLQRAELNLKAAIKCYCEFGRFEFSIFHLESAPRFLQVEGLETTVLTGLNGEGMMMVLNATLPGHTVPTHSHPHEQIGMVYAGKAHLKVGDEEHVARKGDFYCIPANVPHSDTCVGDEPFVMLDVFYPVREDFIEKLRQGSEEQKKTASQ